MSFLTGYVLGKTLNKNSNGSYHKRDFEKEQLKIKCQEQEHQIADLSKKVERLQERLADASKTIDYYDKKDFHYTLADGTVMGAEPAHKYKIKWGVK